MNLINEIYQSRIRILYDMMYCVNHPLDFRLVELNWLGWLGLDWLVNGFLWTVGL